MTRKLFGTDGIRGKINHSPLTADVAVKLGQATAIILNEIHKNGKKKGKPKLILGKDTRVSGYIYENALTSGLCSCGVDVYLVGPLPTPAVAHLIKSFGADAGIMITASHNPAGDNGIKFFDCSGYKLPNKEETKIEGLVLNNELDASNFSIVDVGKAHRIDDARGRYIEYCKSTVLNQSMSQFKVVLDCANGAAYKVAPRIFQELDIDVVVIGDKPDGLNINKDCGSLYPDKLKKEVLKNKADFGVALDGDADRIIMVDEKGDVVDGDEIMALSAIYMKEKGRLINDKVVVTVMSNIGFYKAMKENKIKVETTQVGDKFVIEKMRSTGARLGGEQSGHIIFSKYITTGDGVIAALQIMRAMKHTQKKLSELKKCMAKYPQVLLNFDVKEKKDLEGIKEYRKRAKEIEFELGDEGRILVRYSGTQNCCRVMIEGKDKKVITKYANELMGIIKKEIGA
ncbi:phosphoglucosamine mutase [Candidatus Woesearchaeota archaeon]|mgnify:CR=1 FL=1|jgi:phosphoglucosamine mutase|nr:phosphoglucosamine mutase [Candidatus Woesearchaeota archaeon]MBT5273080.1 phosphoglucosamine mutase [Candidatus Woesearchaeota archaeon]MBT6041018.1 phosphoglucosamine mutase [Candidatus Woesearchaeota archaeon]MBT6337605.1 phosphoglucosamine mutase [Candidatus Woesearchaeota archaeon]MBT7926994.1 phosphoglucosamine mutase [Candidatus Woesearchaeota archaeon]